MQSAFVDIGLERDAFLRFRLMELEEHDEDLTDSVPANRSVQECGSSRRGRVSPHADAQPIAATQESEPQAGFDQEQTSMKPITRRRLTHPMQVRRTGEFGGSSPDRERGGYRGRRRRRGDAVMDEMAVARRDEVRSRELHRRWM